MAGVRLDVDLVELARELARDPAAIAVLVDELARHAEVRAGDDREWLSLGEAGRQLGVTANAVRMLANRGRLRSERLGRRRYVSAVDVKSLGADGAGATLRRQTKEAPARQQPPGA